MINPSLKPMDSTENQVLLCFQKMFRSTHLMVATGETHIRFLIGDTGLSLFHSPAIQ